MMGMDVKDWGWSHCFNQCSVVTHSVVIVLSAAHLIVYCRSQLMRIEVRLDSKNWDSEETQLCYLSEPGPWDPPSKMWIIYFPFRRREYFGHECWPHKTLGVPSAPRNSCRVSLSRLKLRNWRRTPPPPHEVLSKSFLFHILWQQLAAKLPTMPLKCWQSGGAFSYVELVFKLAPSSYRGLKMPDISPNNTATQRWHHLKPHPDRRASRNNKMKKWKVKQMKLVCWVLTWHVPPSPSDPDEVTQWMTPEEKQEENRLPGIGFSKK